MNVVGRDFTSSEFISHFKTEDVIVHTGKLQRLNLYDPYHASGYFLKTLEVVRADLRYPDRQINFPSPYSGASLKSLEGYK